MRMFVKLSRARSLRWAAAAILLLSSSILAKRTFEPVFSPKLLITKTNAAIEIDGDLNDPGWQPAGRVDQFVERFPGDNTEPEVETRAYITYDEDHLYVAFVCLDDPSTIRATMCQRDRYSGDDAVEFLLDTYGDASRAYEFGVNPYGVQKDILWTSVAGEDSGYDLVWESAAKITDSGYQVEMAIPFSSMRFPNRDAQNWKVDFYRYRPRDSYRNYSWAAYDRNEQCWACQWGTVEGISNVQSGKGLEILPTLVAHQYGGLELSDQNEPQFDNADVKGEFSLGGKYSLSSDITLEATYNPDFSQIESDAAQIDVNSTISLFYPERRPFFQEGSDIFRTLFNSFYTRTVNDPELAAKLTVRNRNLSVGFLTARDENSPYMIPLTTSSRLVNAGKSTVNVLRAYGTIGRDSKVGFLASDRRFDGGGSGSVLAVDHDIRISQNYSWDGQYILTHTGEPNAPNLLSSSWQGVTFDDGKYTVPLDGESYYGTAFISRLRRNSRHWGFLIDYNQVSPSYRTEVGYDPLANYRNVSIWNGYTFYPESKFFERIQPQFFISRRWNFDGTRRNGYSQLTLFSRLPVAQTYVSTSFNYYFERWSDIEFDRLWSWYLGFGSQLNSMIGYDVDVNYGRGVATFALTKGMETSVDASVYFKPVDRLIVEPGVSFSKSNEVGTNDKLFSAYITRTRLRYQVSRRLSVRMVVQYVAQDNYVYDAKQRTWDFDPLISYTITPFSVLYIGSTYNYNKATFDEADPMKWRLNERQYFIKLQYQFQT